MTQQIFKYGMDRFAPFPENANTTQRKRNGPFLELFNDRYCILLNTIICVLLMAFAVYLYATNITCYDTGSAFTDAGTRQPGLPL